ncbi:MAG: hypothetical protein LC731_03575, partial [Acidobacteria bacterium]|nr:hypothetical protein [Acidobacteriota bacterium]
MPHSFEVKKSATLMIPLGTEARNESLKVAPLTDEDEREVMAFLAASDSVQAIFMTSVVRDNGLESPFNRGIFYGARCDTSLELVGVALVGHATLVETDDDVALRAFAHLAKARSGVHVYLGEEERIKRFWQYYARGGQRPRLICREMLFELRDAPEASAPEEVSGLRLATLDDLPFVMPVQACMAYEESGVNPLEADAVGFRMRCARRIEQGRVFVWIEQNYLLFKADVLADTSGAAYLEGVYASPSARKQTHGSSCLREVARRLL